MKTADQALVEAHLTESQRSNERLFAACRTIIADRGFRGLSLRAAAKESGWTMGEIAYRLGAKEQLVEAYLDYEASVSRARDEAWMQRLSGVKTFGAPLLAAVVMAEIDDAALNHRSAVVIWFEAMLEAGSGAIPTAPVAAWVETRRAHWRGILADRHPNADVLGSVIADYVIAEQIYSAVLLGVPEYRLMRAACVARLCGAASAEWETFLTPIWDDDATPNSLHGRGRQAENVAKAAGQIILERGPSAVTHRSVAAVLGQSSSAVAHHFGQRIELLKAGFDSLSQNIQAALQNDAPVGAALGTLASPSLPTALGYVRLLHLIALVAAREPTMVPFMLDERASRGRLIEEWYGEELLGRYHDDLVLLQMISLVTGVRTLLSALEGTMVPGASRQALDQLVSVMGQNRTSVR